jgi:dCTP diphosphatase
MDIITLQSRLREFAQARDWEQFHTPKNLAMALAAEAGELLEIFQWLTDEQASAVTGRDEDLQLVRDELADIFIYLVRMADVLRINLENAVETKLIRNEHKYPVELAKGNATKYNRRDSDRGAGQAHRNENSSAAQDPPQYDSLSLSDDVASNDVGVGSSFRNNSRSGP